MYIASEDDRLWLQSVQRKLYARIEIIRTMGSKSCGDSLVPDVLKHCARHIIEGIQVAPVIRTKPN
jgi:hypothetical protein